MGTGTIHPNGKWEKSMQFESEILNEKEKKQSEYTLSSVPGDIVWMEVPLIVVMWTTLNLHRTYMHSHALEMSLVVGWLPDLFELLYLIVCSLVKVFVRTVCKWKKIKLMKINCTGRVISNSNNDGWTDDAVFKRGKCIRYTATFDHQWPVTGDRNTFQIAAEWISILLLVSIRWTFF